MTGCIEHDERIITCEDSAELQLQQPHVVRLETRPPNLEGEGEITMRDLIKNCLRMRPERIIVGEVRGAEAFDLLQAMNTGHDGSMGTLHANNPREALSRLESMIMMGGFTLPTKTIREMIVGSVDIIIQASRLRDGSRRVTHITEVVGMEEGTITLQNLIVYDILGEDANGKLIGRHRSRALPGPPSGNAHSTTAKKRVSPQPSHPLKFSTTAAVRWESAMPDQMMQLMAAGMAAITIAALTYVILYPSISGEKKKEQRIAVATESRTKKLQVKNASEVAASRKKQVSESLNGPRSPPEGNPQERTLAVEARARGLRARREAVLHGLRNIRSGCHSCSTRPVRRLLLPHVPAPIRRSGRLAYCCRDLCWRSSSPAARTNFCANSRAASRSSFAA